MTLNNGIIVVLLILKPLNLLEKQEIKLEFFSESTIGKMDVFFAPIVALKKYTELLKNDINAKNVDISFMILSIGGLIN